MDVRAKLFATLVFGSVAAAILVNPGFVGLTMVLIVLAILNAKPYALVLTDVSALVVRLSRGGRVLDVTRIDKDAFPAARAWSKGDVSFLRIELDTPLTISNPKLFSRDHTYDQLLQPLGVDTSEVYVHRKPQTRKQQRNG